MAKKIELEVAGMKKDMEYIKDAMDESKSSLKNVNTKLDSVVMKLNSGEGKIRSIRDGLTEHKTNHKFQFTSTIAIAGVIAVIVGIIFANT